MRNLFLSEYSSLLVKNLSAMGIGVQKKWAISSVARTRCSYCGDGAKRCEQEKQ